MPTWADYVAVAVDEIISAGSGALPVQRRLERLLKDVAALAPPERRAALERRLGHLGAPAPAGSSTELGPGLNRAR